MKDHSYWETENFVLLNFVSPECWHAEQMMMYVNLIQKNAKMFRMERKHGKRWKTIMEPFNHFFFKSTTILTKLPVLALNITFIVNVTL